MSMFEYSLGGRALKLPISVKRALQSLVQRCKKGAVPREIPRNQSYFSFHVKWQSSNYSQSWHASLARSFPTQIAFRHCLMSRPLHLLAVCKKTYACREELSSCMDYLLRLIMIYPTTTIHLKLELKNGNDVTEIVQRVIAGSVCYVPPIPAQSIINKNKINK
jgi:hypothetical protein